MFSFVVSSIFLIVQFAQILHTKTKKQLCTLFVLQRSHNRKYLKNERGFEATQLFTSNHSLWAKKWRRVGMHHTKKAKTSHFLLVNTDATDSKKKKKSPKNERSIYFANLPILISRQVSFILRKIAYCFCCKSHAPQKGL